MNFEEMVREFHKKHNIPTNTPLSEKFLHSLSDAATTISVVSEVLLIESKDKENDRLFRAHLICEETYEVLDAMMRGDETLLLDALTDLMYVTVGAAVTFGLPLEAAFVEVHRSNMTKKVTGEHRLRDKGEDYSPPDIEGVLRCARSS